MPKLLMQLSRVGMACGTVKMPVGKRKAWAQLQHCNAKSLSIQGEAVPQRQDYTLRFKGSAYCFESTATGRMSGLLTGNFNEGGQLLTVQNEASRFYPFCTQLTVTGTCDSSQQSGEQVPLWVCVLPHPGDMRQRKYSGLLVCVQNVHIMSCNKLIQNISNNKNKQWQLQLHHRQT